MFHPKQEESKNKLPGSSTVIGRSSCAIDISEEDGDGTNYTGGDTDHRQDRAHNGLHLFSLNRSCGGGGISERDGMISPYVVLTWLLICQPRFSRLQILLKDAPLTFPSAFKRLWTLY